MPDIEIQAIAHVSQQDVVGAIAGLEAHEINDIFLSVAEKLTAVEDITKLWQNLARHCHQRFGV